MGATHSKSLIIRLKEAMKKSMYTKCSWTAPLNRRHLKYEPILILNAFVWNIHLSLAGSAEICTTIIFFPQTSPCLAWQ